MFNVHYYTFNIIYSSVRSCICRQQKINDNFMTCRDVSWRTNAYAYASWGPARSHYSRVTLTIKRLQLCCLSRSDNYRVRFHYKVQLRYQHIVVARVILFSDFIVNKIGSLADCLTIIWHLYQYYVPYRTSPFIVLISSFFVACASVLW